VTIALFGIYAGTALGAPPLPRPWKSGQHGRVRVDSSVLYEGQPSFSIEFGFPPQTQIGPGLFTAKYSVISAVYQEIKADQYRGRRIRWSGYMRTNDVGSVWNREPPVASRIAASAERSPGAGLFVINDSCEATVLYAMTRDRLIGTNDWTKVEMIFDVPVQSAIITIGFFLSGKGRLWAAGFALEEVTPATEATFDLDLTDEQKYDYTFARHKKRLKQYARSPYAPVLLAK